MGGIRGGLMGPRRKKRKGKIIQTYFNEKYIKCKFEILIYKMYATFHNSV